ESARAATIMLVASLLSKFTSPTDILFSSSNSRNELSIQIKRAAKITGESKIRGSVSHFLLSLLMSLAMNTNICFIILIANASFLFLKILSVHQRFHSSILRTLDQLHR